MKLLSLVVATFTGFAGGPSDVDWSEWRLISPNLSTLAFALPRQNAGITVAQSESHDSNGAWREEWVWDSGRMFVLNVGQGRYLERYSKKTLKEYVTHVAAEEGLNVIVERSDIGRAQNQIDNYSFAEVGVDDPKMSCFFFLQYFGGGFTPGLAGGGGVTATGLMRGFDCQPTATASLGDHETTMHAYVRGLSRQ